MDKIPQKNNHEYWDTRIKDLVQSENEILNQRLGWLFQIQGLLFAALAFSWGERSWPLTVCLAFVGISTAISIGKMIKYFSHAMHNLHTWSVEVNHSWNEVPNDWQEHRSSVMGYWSPSESSSIDSFLRPWRLLPIIFFVAWIAVVIIAFFSGGFSNVTST